MKIWILGIGLMSCMLNGCSMDALMATISAAKNMELAKVWIEQVNFKVDEAVNDEAPLAVHLLIFYDKEVLGAVSKLSADDYFQKQATIESDNPQNIQFFKWEVIPGQKIDPEKLNLEKVSGIGGVIFARYSSPGPHRVALADEREIEISLNKDDFKVKKIR